MFKDTATRTEQEEIEVINALLGNHALYPQAYSIRLSSYSSGTSGTLGTSGDEWPVMVARASGSLLTESFISLLGNINSGTGIFLTPELVAQEGTNKMPHYEGLKYLEQLLRIEETLRIYYFEETSNSNFWVIVKDADIELEKKYSGYLLATLKKFPSLECDLIVFDEDEIGCASEGSPLLYL